MTENKPAVQTSVSHTDTNSVRIEHIYINREVIRSERADKKMVMESLATEPEDAKNIKNFIPSQPLKPICLQTRLLKHKYGNKLICSLEELAQ